MKGQGQARSLPLPRALKLEAIALALEMIWTQPDVVVVRVLMKEYTINDMAARRIIAEARSRVAEAFSQVQESFVEKATLELNAVFRAAVRDKKYAAAVSAKRTQIELLTGRKLDDRKEFGDGRSEEDLRFFAERGFWPEDYVVIPGVEVEVEQRREADPLALLPPVESNGTSNSNG